MSEVTLQAPRSKSPSRTPKFFATQSYEDSEIETILKIQATRSEKIELLCEVVLQKNKIIEKLRQEFQDLYRLYEEVVEDNNKLNLEKKRGLSKERSKDETSSFLADNRESLVVREAAHKRSLDRRPDASPGPFRPREGSLAATTHTRSKWPSADNSLSLSAIGPAKDAAPLFAQKAACALASTAGSVDGGLQPLLNFLARRYDGQFADVSQLLPCLRFDFDRLHTHAQFFAVLHRAALELTPGDCAANLSANPKDLWRWLKALFARFVQLRERSSVFHAQLGRDQRDRDGEERDALIDAFLRRTECSSLAELHGEFEALLLSRQTAEVLAQKVASIFALPRANCTDVLQALDAIERSVAAERRQPRESVAVVHGSGLDQGE